MGTASFRPPLALASWQPLPPPAAPSAAVSAPPGHGGARRAAAAASCAATLAVGSLPSRGKRARPTVLWRHAVAMEDPSVVERVADTKSSPSLIKAEEVEAVTPVAKREVKYETLESALPELRDWLLAKNCTGVDDVSVNVTGRSGVRLLVDVKKETEFVKVPKEAWISVNMVDSLELAPEAELAWKVVQEKWLGSSSDFAPYINFLWGLDLSMHTLYWEKKELMWLRRSPRTYAEVVKLRNVTVSRVKALEKRTTGFGLVKPNDKKEVRRDLRFALALVEQRAAQIEAKEGLPKRMAMVPLLDHIDHDPLRRPDMFVGPDNVMEEPVMAAMSKNDLKAGRELRHCYEEASSGELLVRYGTTPPNAVVADLETRIEANAFDRVALPVVFKRKNAGIDDETSVQMKWEVLASELGIDLRDGAEPNAALLELPKDYMPGGRLCQVARFIARQLPAGCSKEEAKSALVEEKEVELPTIGDNLETELEALAGAWEWTESALKRLKKVTEQISTEVESTVQSGKMEVAVQDADLESLVDTIVLAHYKAKSKSGKTAKSKKYMEARLQSVSPTAAAVMFSTNGVMQQIPRDWVVARMGDVTDSLTARRAMLVLDMYNLEAAPIQKVFDALQSLVRMAWDANGKLKEGQTDEAEQSYKLFAENWQMVMGKPEEPPSEESKE